MPVPARAASRRPGSSRSITTPASSSRDATGKAIGYFYFDGLGTASTRRCRGVALTSGFRAHRKWKYALPSTDTTRLTQPGSIWCNAAAVRGARVENGSGTIDCKIVPRTCCDLRSACQANRFGGGPSDAPSFRGKLVGHCKPSRYERDGAPYKRSSYGNLAFNMWPFIQDKVQ